MLRLELETAIYLTNETFNFGPVLLSSLEKLLQIKSWTFKVMIFEIVLQR